MFIKDKIKLIIIIIICCLIGIMYINVNSNNIINDQHDIHKKELQDISYIKYNNENIKFISINNNTLKINIDLLKGNIIKTELLQYLQSIKNSNPIILFNNNRSTTYLANNGFVINKIKDHKLIFDSYKINHYKNNISVDLFWKDISNNIQFIKTYTLYNNEYTIHVNEKFINNSSLNINGRFYEQLIRTKQLNIKNNLLNTYTSYSGPVISSDQNHYQKYNLTNIIDHNLNIQTKNGWISFISRYFLSAWIPESTDNNFTIYSQNNKNIYSIGIIYPEYVISPHSIIEHHAMLYTGPIIPKLLNSLSPYLSNTIDYGILSFISKLLFYIMSQFYIICGNWGFSIIGITILIKFIFYPLSVASYRSLAKIKLIAPQLQNLKNTFKDDKHALGKATIDLYKKEKINPLGGCLPVIIQIPVFFSLYWVLIKSVELRQAPFILWIKDLSEADPYYVLPIIMGITMFIQQKLNENVNQEDFQKKLMLFVPIIFTIMFLSFPSGLVLYWLVNNIFSIIQQSLINKKYEK